MSPIKRRTLIGLLQGVYGVVLMQFGIPLEGGVLIDLRTIPIMIAAYLGGWVSTLLATTIVIICRLLFYPFSYAAVTNIAVLSISAVAFSLICRSRMKVEKKWIVMALAFITILGGLIHLVIPDFTKATIIWAQYALSILCATYATYILKSYLWRSDENYAKLKDGAQTDYLTGLHNVRSFTDAIDSALLQVKDKNVPLSLILTDIDHFKRINDTYGHPAGDAILKQIAHILMQSCRSTDVVSRNGGEEFSIIMADCDSTYASTIAERVRQTVEESTFTIDGDVDLKLTISVGYATIYPKSMVAVEQFFQQADNELYMAKRMGRNRISPGPRIA